MPDAKSPAIFPNNVRGAFYARKPTRHNLAIDALCAVNPAIMQNGFWAAVEALAKELDYEIKIGGFLPDAFQIDRAACEIILHEVVDTSDLSPAKLARIGDFWMDWDGEGDTDWLPRLIVHRVDYPTEPQEVDLCGVFHRFTMSAESAAS